MKIIIYQLILLGVVFIPLAAGAENIFIGDPSNKNTYTGNPTDTIKLANPLGDINSFPELIKAILDAAFIIGLPIAVLFIVLAGFRFVWARGNPEQLKTAKRNLLYTVVGIAVFFGAWLITDVIVGTLRTLNVNI
ncbi:MAG: pilin [Candidatus Adlerbacteria bacterium]|nr:pilin [Candidatus Adlerbacteria bacterium]MDZ4226473.1 pilin [Patescibacteria group bacterium]